MLAGSFGPGRPHDEFMYATNGNEQLGTSVLEETPSSPTELPQQTIPLDLGLTTNFVTTPQDQPRPSWNPVPQPPYQPMPAPATYNQGQNTIRTVFEILGTVLAVCALICLFIMMVLLVGSYQPESFIPAALAVLATSVITSCIWYWGTKNRR